MGRIMIMDKAVKIARSRKQDILTVENLFEALKDNNKFVSAYRKVGGDIQELSRMLDFYFEEYDYNNEELCGELKSLSESNNLMNLKYRIEKKAEESGTEPTLSILLLAVYEELDQRDYIIQALTQCTRSKDKSIIVDMAKYIMSMGDDAIDLRLTTKKLSRPQEEPPTLMLGIGGMGMGLGGMKMVNMGSLPFGSLFSMGGENMAQQTRDNQSEDDDATITELKLEEYRSLVCDVRKRATGKLFTGREEKLQELVDVLCRRDKGNSILIGEAGVGKSAMLDGFAELINKNVNVPQVLQNVDIVELDTSDLVRDTKYRGDFESKFVGLLEHLQGMAKESGHCVVLCIDEIHTLMGAGETSDGNLDGASILKKFITDGYIKVIGCTTYDEYRSFVEKKKAFCRRFKSIRIEEPTISESIVILNGIKANYESYHGVTYTEEAINSCVTLSSKFIKDRFLPDKAIDLLDGCGAYVVSHGIKERNIGKDIVEKVISTICKIPKEKVETSNVARLKTLGADMKKMVFGQDKAIDEIERAIRNAEAGLNDDNKPVANLIFVGPTGTGKTETARALADKLDIPLIKYDMSEYSDDTAVNKMIGAGAGYIGHEDGGLLVNDVRKHPYCVLLLDEIEKANRKVFDLLLGVMDDGKLTDNKGNTADFTNVIIIMTSNAGASEIGKGKLGFSTDESQSTVGYEAIEQEMKRMFKPEFRNRLNAIVMFNGINKEMSLLIAKKLLDRVLARARAKGVSIVVDGQVYEKVANCGVKLDTGAREMERYINTNIKPLLSDFLLFECDNTQRECRLEVDKDGKFVFIKG